MKVPGLDLPRFRMGKLGVPRLGLAGFRRRIFFRAVFALLVLATLGLALTVLRHEKERSYLNYQNSFRKTQSEILARLRHPAGQLALLNPQHEPAAPGQGAELSPLLLPFGALDFDDPFKAQQALESSGCAVLFQDGSSACAAIGSNPYAGGFVYLAGSFVSPPLVGRERGQLELQDVHRARVHLTLRGQTTRWIAPLELVASAASQPQASLVGRWAGFRAPEAGAAPDTLQRKTRPVRDFRGWVWQSPDCAEEGQAQPDCPRRAFYSIRLPSDALRVANLPPARVVWPPADLADIRVGLQIVGPASAQLLDTAAPRQAEPSALAELAQSLLPGESLRIQRLASTLAPGLTRPPATQTLHGSADPGERESPWVRHIVGLLPVDTRVPLLQAVDTVATPVGRFEITLTGDVRTVERRISIVATRLLWLVGAMLGAIVLAWLLIEIGLIRRVTQLTRRAAAVSYNVHAPLPENRLADLDVSDLRGSDELGILAGGLSDLLQRVKNDISREHQRAQQELDMWHAVGHEIMSPLQSLMVLHGRPEDPSHRYVQRMQQAVKVLYGHASPSEAIVAADMASERLNIHAFLRQIADNAHFSGIDGVRYLDADNPGLAGLQVRADGFALEDVVTHLLRNAQRCRTPGTAITLSLTADPQHAWIAVHNQGPAIDAALLPRIFDYGVSDLPPTEGHRGQGLFVVKTYMGKMGGTVQARNVADGVLFTLGLARMT